MITTYRSRLWRRCPSLARSICGSLYLYTFECTVPQHQELIPCLTFQYSKLNFLHHKPVMSVGFTAFFLTPGGAAEPSDQHLLTAVDSKNKSSSQLHSETCLEDNF